MSYFLFSRIYFTQSIWLCWFHMRALQYHANARTFVRKSKARAYVMFSTIGLHSMNSLWIPLRCFIFTKKWPCRVTIESSRTWLFGAATVPCVGALARLVGGYRYSMFTLIYNLESELCHHSGQVIFRSYALGQSLPFLQLSSYFLQGSTYSGRILAISKICIQPPESWTVGVTRRTCAWLTCMYMYVS